MGEPVPVTAKLSREFYERLGNDVVNELVGLLNLADATYRLELREQNELNFARFEAKLEQRIAELRVELSERFARLDAKIGGMATKEQLEKGLREQTTMFFAAWGVLLASSIALWFR
jgi:hypothetical protein